MVHHTFPIMPKFRYNYTFIGSICHRLLERVAIMSGGHLYNLDILREIKFSQGGSIELNSLDQLRDKSPSTHRILPFKCRQVSKFCVMKVHQLKIFCLIQDHVRVTFVSKLITETVIQVLE